MGRTKRERPKTYHKVRLPNGFYINQKTGVIKKQRKRPREKTGDTTTTLESSTSGLSPIESDRPNDVGGAYNVNGTEEFPTMDILPTTTESQLRERLALKQRLEELPRDSPLFHFESDDVSMAKAA